jgi:hypothetical protein
VEQLFDDLVLVGQTIAIIETEGGEMVAAVVAQLQVKRPLPK